MSGQLQDSLHVWRSRAAGDASHPQFAEKVAVLRSIAVLSALPDSAAASILGASELHDYQAQARLVAQGDPSVDAVILLAGEVGIYNESPHGRTLLSRAEAPALLGEIGALAQLPRTASIIARTQVTALRVPRAALAEVARQTPDILLSVVGRLGQQIQGVNSALGLFSGSLTALERDDLDPEALLSELNNPTAAMRDFAEAFRRLAHHITNERRTRRELASAALIQKAMLPQSLDGLDPRGRARVLGAMRPAHDVGGDFYDAFLLDEHRLALLIGDVCGKGVPASLFMSFSVTALRLVAKQEPDVGAVVRRANALLHEQNAASMFSTVFYGVLDLASGRLDYTNCGHNAPLIARRDGRTTALVSGGTPLGILPERQVRTHGEYLGTGDCLLLFTDGATESHDAAGVEYGEERLAETLRLALNENVADIPLHIVEDVLAYSRGVEQFDDITCLAVSLA